MRYRDLLRAPGARHLVLAGLAGRAPMGMMAMTLVLAADAAGGTFALAGGCAAAFHLAEGLGSPVQGRLVDRHGIRRVLPPLAAGCAAALLAFALLSGVGHAGPALLVLAAATGACMPILSTATRALWVRVVPDPAGAQAAFALETVLTNATWVAGPLLAAALVAIASPSVALAGGAVLVLAGTAGFATHPVARGWQPPDSSARAGAPLRAAPVRTLALGTLGVGVVGGSLDVTVAAFAIERERPAAAGLVLAGFCLASMASGLVHGRRSHRAPAAHRYARELAILAAAVALIPLAWDLPSLALAATFAGLALAPVLADGYVALRELVAHERLTEAFAWLSATFGAGVACGAIAAGPVIDAAGAGTALWLLPLWALAAAAAVGLRRVTLVSTAPAAS